MAFMATFNDIGLCEKDRNVIPILQSMLALRDPPGALDHLQVCKLIELVDSELGKRERGRIVAERKKRADEKVRQTKGVGSLFSGVSQGSPSHRLR
jgi:hypothetical protein